MSEACAEAAFDRFVLEIAASRRELVDAIVSRFVAGTPRTGASERLRFEVSAMPARGVRRVPAGGRVVYESEGGSVYWDDAEARLEVFTPSGYATCLPAGALVEIDVDEGAPDAVWAASRPLFTIPFLELLRARGLYGVHAGGAGRGGRGVLLAGTSGVGKSTLTAALVACGFSLLGDDMLFLEAGGDGEIGVLPFPDVLDLSERSLELLGLGDVARSRLAGAEKWQVSPVDAELSIGADRARVELLVFPSRSAGRPRLSEIGVEEALLELAPNVLLTDPARAQAHLDVLARVAGSAQAFRLQAGDDPADAAKAIAGALV